MRDIIFSNIYAISIFNVIVFGISILSLFYAIRTYYSPDEKKIIRDQKSEGTQQKFIKRLSYVRIFLQHLKHIEEKNINIIWDEMLSKKRKNLFSNNIYSFECEYLLTHRYKVEYIIPISENIDRANFWALVEFNDLISDNEVKNIKSYLNTEIKIFPAITNEIINEVYSIINFRFETSQAVDIKKKICAYIQKMTIQSIIEKDWRFPILIAKELGLKPKKIKFPETFAGKIVGHHIWCDVVMVKESKKWKVEEFQTIAISRWK
ncbi:MAG: hypothetical protein LBI28_03595 [Treponema sp.]|jgi:hypothetical protein|nr:hypothetical protein [Treponema sp.]